MGRNHETLRDRIRLGGHLRSQWGRNSEPAMKGNILGANGQPIPRKPKPFNPPPENKNFKADFQIEIPKHVVRGAPYLIVVMGSMAPDASSVMVAVELKFRNGVVISGGPLHMEIKEDEEV